MRPPESFIGQPIRSLQTMLRVIAEDAPGYKRIIPDGIYGPETVQAVTVFQKRHGLPATGITDQNTWEAVVARYEPARISREEAQPLHILLNPGQILSPGQQHPHLFLVQGMLAALAAAYSSILAPEATGILDNATADALSAFQQLSGLPASGSLDKMTWKHLALHYPLAAEVALAYE